MKVLRNELRKAFDERNYTEIKRLALELAEQEPLEFRFKLDVETTQHGSFIFGRPAKDWKGHEKFVRLTGNYYELMNPVQFLYEKWEWCRLVPPYYFHKILENLLSQIPSLERE